MEEGLVMLGGIAPDQSLTTSAFAALLVAGEFPWDGNCSGWEREGSSEIDMHLSGVLCGNR